MKKEYFVGLLFGLLVFAGTSQAKQTTAVKSLAKVGVAPAGGGGSPSSQPAVNPLDKPFYPKHTYKGTKIPLNVIPISIHPVQRDGTSAHWACSAFRINKHWLLTAAHCVEYLGTKNHKIYAAVRPIKLFKNKKEAQNSFEVSLSPEGKDAPANAELYFYREGYFTGEKKKDNPFAAAEDIALIRLDEKDSSLAKARQSVRQTKEKIQALEGMFSETDILVPLRKEEERINSAESARKKFFAQPLDSYSFFATPPEGVGHYDNHSGLAYFFKPTDDFDKTGNRFFPVEYKCPFIGNLGKGSHELAWKCLVDHGTSGSPIIINGFVVSDMSEGHVDKYGSGQMVTPLYALPFQQFLRRAMGKEYPKGLCVSPNLPSNTPKWEPKK